LGGAPTLLAQNSAAATPEAERFAFATGQEARAGKNSFPPTPFLFARPSVQFGAPQLRGRQFRSKKVRISSNKRTIIKLSGILPTDSAARSAAENGNTGSPRTARLAKRRFGITCDFKCLLCPIKN